MQLINTTDWPDYFLRRMVSWCCRELGLPVRFVKRIKFGNRRTQLFSGHCRHWQSGCQIVVNIADDESRFPWTDGGKSSCIKGIVRTFQDRTECLVNVTAHELRHALAELDKERTRGSGRRVASSERATEHSAQIVQAAFNANRNELLEAWNKTAIRTVKSKPSKQEQRAEAARKKLAEWTRKKKLATTKERKYAKQVRYYEKQLALAATRSQGY